MEFFEFFFDIAGNCGVADIGVDLATGGDTDTDGLQAFFQVNDVGRDDHAAPGHFAADEFGV
jgi:hypothetical protein